MRNKNSLIPEEAENWEIVCHKICEQIPTVFGVLLTILIISKIIGL